MEFALNDERKTKFVNSLALTMDYDSGYMSHNPESNLDSSLEFSVGESLLKNGTNKPIYLSEDALLEKPEIKKSSLNLSFQIENENYEETRRLFYSPEKEESDTVISDSVISQDTNYSGFNDSELENNISPVIASVRPIVVDIANIKNNLNVIYNDEKDSGDVSFKTVPDTENNFSGKLDKDIKTKLPSALSNITNTLTNDSSKKLTLIFSKADKENIYSVKRKFQSLSPKQDSSSEKAEPNSSLEGSYVSEKDVSSTTETDKSAASLSESMDIDNSNIDVSIQVSCTDPLLEDTKLSEVNENVKAVDVETPTKTFDSYIKPVDVEIPTNIFNSYIKPIVGIPTNIFDSYISIDKMKLEYLIGRGDSISEISVCNELLQDTLEMPSKTLDEICTNMNTDTLNTLSENVFDPVERTQIEVKIATIPSNEEKLYSSELHEESTNVNADESIAAATEADETCKNVQQQNQETCSSKIIDDNSQILSHISEIVVNNNFAEIVDISATPEKKIQNKVDPNNSPDLFEEEETLELPPEVPIRPNVVAAEKYIVKKDHTLIKRAYKSLKGFLPPQSITVVQLSVDQMLNKIEINKDYFWDKDNTSENKNSVLNSKRSINNYDGFKSLLISEPVEAIQKKKWPAVMEGRCLGAQ